MRSVGLSKQSRAFSLIELMIALLIVSALGISISQFIRSQATNLSQSDSSRSLDKESTLIAKFFRDDFAPAVFLNPACAGRYVDATIACSSIPFQGGITPLPGQSKEDLETPLSYAPPADIAATSFSFESDAVRVLQYDFENQFDCTLDRSISDNPSSSAEIMTVSSDCASQLSVGQLYILVEEMSTVLYSNVFQITGVNGNEISMDSSSNQFNQPNGLGISGYSNLARIFPVRIIELAVSSADGGLYRRITSPSSTDMAGLGQWRLLNDRVENVQYFYTSATSSTINDHFRGVSGINLSEIRGVSPWFVARAQSTSGDSALVDNPMTSAIENDKYERNQNRFFVSMYNFSE